jgi:hypothetical protein
MSPGESLMFRIGTIRTTKYTIRIAPPPMDLLENKFYLPMEIRQLMEVYWKGFYYYDREYFLCIVNDAKRNAYVDLVKDERFPFVSFRFPPKSSKEQTPAEAIYETEYRYWAHNKDHQQPMLYLHHSTLEKVIDRCKELSE